MSLDTSLVIVYQGSLVIKIDKLCMLSMCIKSYHLVNPQSDFANG